MTKYYISMAAAFLVLQTFNSSAVEAFQSPATTITTNNQDQNPFAVAGSGRRGPIGFLGSQRQDPLAAATEKLKAAESSEEKDEAMDTIRKELEKQYDQFLEDNEKQIEQLQVRLDNLREQLVRRKNARSKMVDLEVERVINASDGLIWPNRSGRRSGFSSGSFWEPTPGPNLTRPGNAPRGVGRSTR